MYGLDTNCTFAKLAVAALYINQMNVSLKLFYLRLQIDLIVTNDDMFVDVNGRKFPSAGVPLSMILASTDLTKPGTSPEQKCYKLIEKEDLLKKHFKLDG